MEFDNKELYSIKRALVFFIEDTISLVDRLNGEGPISHLKQQLRESQMVLDSIREQEQA